MEDYRTQKRVQHRGTSKYGFSLSCPLQEKGKEQGKNNGKNMGINLKQS